jgi:Carboxypeptidase regulatory-like domain
MKDATKSEQGRGGTVACHLLAGLLLSIMISTSAWGQVTAQLSGTITDQSGALLPGVEITATNSATSTARKTISNDTGSYVLPNLPLGPYTLEATLPGFSVFSETGIVLQVGDNKVINAVLQVGAVTETVEVQANAALVETRNTGIGQILDNTRVLELPLNGRVVTELIALSGAAITAPSGNTDRNYPTLGVSLGGGHDNMLTFRMDGGTHNDPYNNLNMPLPFPDALREFKVETSAIPARYGQHSAGLVSVVTKSGTNTFHGSGFEFVRNQVFNARNAFATKRDSLKRNQLGGTLGGPIVRNRLFFFGGYQRTFERSSPSSNFQFVPTAQVLAGDFRLVASEECRGPGRGITVAGTTATLRTAFPFVNNQINPALFSPAAVKIAARLPKTNDPCGRADFSKLSNQDEHQMVTRVDSQLSSSHSMFVRYSIHHLKTPSDYDGKVLLGVLTANYGRQYQSGVFGETWTINNNLINSFRVTGFRTSNEKSFPDTFGPTDVGITNLYYPSAPFPKMMILSVTDAFSLLSNVVTPSFTNTTAYEISNDLGWVRGDHQFAFGGSFMRQIMYVSAATSAPGEWVFANQGTGLGIADFMIGYAEQFRDEPVSTWYPRQDFISTYAQDTWKLNNKFTFNFGVRWEPFTPQVRTDKRHGTFQRDWFDRGQRSTVYLNAPKGFLYSGGSQPVGVPGDQGMPDYSRTSNNLWAHFAPRVGMAWDVSGDGRTSVRSAYGIFFDYPHMYQFNGLRNTPPYDPRIQRMRYAGALDDPFNGYPGGNPYPIPNTQNLTFPAGALFQELDTNFKTPYVHQWNFSIQRQINREWIATANYIGNSTIHLTQIRDANPMTAGVRELTRVDPTSPYGALNKYDDGGTANYNALWLSLERQSKEMNLRMNYTWAHCIDEGTSPNSVNTGRVGVQRRYAEHGDCDIDRRQLFNMSTVYETPGFANPTLRALAGGWRISGILKLLSGDSFSVMCGCDSARTQETAQYGLQLIPNVFPSNKTAAQYLNPAAFTLPALGSYGNMARNSIAGPGTFTLDMGLTRRFGIAENQALEFRAEVFNLPNHVNWNNPISSMSSPTFGQVTSAADPRIMQFALKYIF